MEILLLLVVLLYFVPTIIALARGHHNTTAIVLTNILLGWTFLGWVAAFIWAVTAINPALVTPARNREYPAGYKVMTAAGLLLALALLNMFYPRAQNGHLTQSPPSSIQTGSINGEAWTATIQPSSSQGTGR